MNLVARSPRGRKQRRRRDLQAGLQGPSGIRKRQEGSRLGRTAGAAWRRRARRQPWSSAPTTPRVRNRQSRCEELRASRADVRRSGKGEAGGRGDARSAVRAFRGLRADSELARFHLRGIERQPGTGSTYGSRISSRTTSSWGRTCSRRSIPPTSTRTSTPNATTGRPTRSCAR